jgi:integrase
MPTIVSPTVTELAEKYFSYYGQARRSKSLKSDQELLRDIILPAFGHLEVKLIDRHTIKTLHNQLSGKPHQANRILALLSKIFSFAVSWRWRRDNPVKGVEKYQIKKQDRQLNPDELGRFWLALDQYPNHLMAYFFKFLTLTGVRQGEGIQAAWDQFNLEEGVWVKPSYLTKQQKATHLKLSNKALKVLDQIKKLTGQTSPYVFSRCGGRQPIKREEARVFWKTIMEAAKLEDFHICNLRTMQAS